MTYADDSPVRFAVPRSKTFSRVLTLVTQSQHDHGTSTTVTVSTVVIITVIVIGRRQWRW